MPDNTIAASPKMKIENIGAAVKNDRRSATMRSRHRRGRREGVAQRNEDSAASRRCLSTVTKLYQVTTTRA
jgi:hypothetical protein